MTTETHSNSTQSSTKAYKDSKSVIFEPEIVKVFVPSYKRANNVLTTKSVANCTLVVPVSQVADYEKHNPEVPVVGCPDNIKGISNTRQWIYDTYKNVFMLDDDIDSVQRLNTPTKYSAMRFTHDDIPDKDKMTPEESYNMIQGTAYLAKQLGVYLFGFTSAVTPRDVKPMLPFSLKGYVKGTTMGLFEGSKLFFPKEPEGQQCEDHFVTLLNAYYHRYCLLDNRVMFHHIGTFKTVGGCSEYRTSDNEEKSYKYLRRKFGEAVQLKIDGTTVKGKVRKRSHKWERTLNLPF